MPKKPSGHTKERRERKWKAAASQKRSGKLQAKAGGMTVERLAEMFAKEALESPVEPARKREPLPPHLQPEPPEAVSEHLPRTRKRFALGAAADPNLAQVMTATLYPEQLRTLDRIVKISRARGGRLSRSQAIRWAIDNANWKELPDI